MKRLLVVAYDKRYNSRWEIIDTAGKVLHTFRTRKVALKAMKQYE